MAGIDRIATAKILGLRCAERPIGSFAQQRQLLGIKLAQIAGFLIEHQRPVADAANLLDKMADFLEHFAQFAVASLNQNHFVPGIVALAHLADTCRRSAHLRRSRTAALDGNAGTENIELAFGGLSGHFHQVGLFHAGCGAREPIGEFAVVGHQQQAFAHVVKAAYGVKALLELVKKLHDGGAAFRVLDCGHEALGFVQDEITEALGAMQQLPVDADVVAAGVGLRSQLRHSLAIHLNAALLNHLLGLTAACYAGLGQDLLQALQFSGRALR
jgi:hypothetical protein